MFSAAPMLQLWLLVLERHSRAVLCGLSASGAVQLRRVQAGPETAPLPPRDCAPELARTNRLLTGVAELRRMLEIAPGFSRAGHWDRMDLEEAERKIQSVDQRVRAMMNRRRNLAQRLAGLNAEYAQVSEYGNLEVPLGPSGPESFLHFVTGTMPAGNLGQVESGLGRGACLLPLPERQGRLPLIAMSTIGDKGALERLLRQAGFEPEPLPEVEGATTGSLCRQREQERKEVLAGVGDLEMQVREVAADSAGLLEEIEDLARFERRLLEAIGDFPRTESAVLITGWVPAADVPAVQREVWRTTAGRCALTVAAADGSAGEPVPVLLRHARWFRPFERLVAAYGLPAYGELEPTLFVAASFLVMFGMMFGDAGHGAVLGAAGLALVLGLAGEKRRDTGRLLLLAGLSSVFFGFLYGSCFGLTAFKKYALWRDPLEGDLMTLMRGAIGIGVLMISLGLVLNVINRFRQGDVLGGLLDKFGLAGALFYWSALALVGKAATAPSRQWLWTAAVACLLAAVAGWVLKGPIEYLARRRAGGAGSGEGLFGALAESLGGAFEAGLSYFANTISFVRLAAYAISHAALLAAAFLMAAELRHLAGGALLGAAVIVLGNLAAILLEGVIASVQALRLEYYEFFGKFFSGSGRAFVPFRLPGAGRAVFRPG